MSSPATTTLPVSESHLFCKIHRADTSFVETLLASGEYSRFSWLAEGKKNYVVVQPNAPYINDFLNKVDRDNYINQNLSQYSFNKIDFKTILSDLMHWKVNEIVTNGGTNADLFRSFYETGMSAPDDAYVTQTIQYPDQTAVYGVAYQKHFFLFASKKACDCFIKCAFRG